jgi:6-phosphogluconolactonase/glucosamine-6-phosphate isomerase/deaminase
MTLTYPVLAAGLETLFVVTGDDKADAFARIRAGGSGLPSERVSGDGVRWIVDAAVARATEDGR